MAVHAVVTSLSLHFRGLTIARVFVKGVRLLGRVSYRILHLHVIAGKPFCDTQHILL